MQFISKLSIFQPPFVFLPWVKRSHLRCFSRKAGEPDFPIRYTPKKLQDVNEKRSYLLGDDTPHTNSLSSGNVEDKVLDAIGRSQGSGIDHEQENALFDNVHGAYKKTDKQRKRALKTKSIKTPQEIVDHVIVPEEVHGLQISKKDGQSQQFTLNQVNHDLREYIETLASDVKEVQLYNDVTDEIKQKKSETCRTEQGAKKLAIQLLAKRALTEVELHKKLTAKKFPDIVVEVVVCDFKNRGLINDRLYAEVFCSSRWKSSSWGPRRIKQELVKKGINEDDIQKAVKLVFEDKNREESSNITLSGSSLQQLYTQASKQWERSKNVTHETRKARVIRWLQYRGFDWGVISGILRKLEAQRP